MTNSQKYSVTRNFMKCIFMPNRDSLIVSLGNCLTSFFAGFVVFSFLGYLADQEQTSVKDVTDSGNYFSSSFYLLLFIYYVIISSIQKLDSTFIQS